MGQELIEAMHHTTADWGRLHRWLAESCLRKGQRRAALGQFARAAVRGQVPNVVSDVGAILRRKVARRIPRLQAARTVSRDAWIAAAAEWLRELRGVRRRAHEGAGDARSCLPAASCTS